jgi:hypothetical protein
VLNGLRGDFNVPSDRAGFLFEHLLFNQIRTAAAARELRCNIHNFRTRGGLEIDFIVELGDRVWAIEAKSGAVDVDRAAATFAQARRYLPAKTEMVVATTGKERKRSKQLRILPWQALLQEMGL